MNGRSIPINGGQRMLDLDDTQALPEAPAADFADETPADVPPPRPDRPAHRSLADIFGGAARRAANADQPTPQQGSLSPRHVAATLVGVVLLIVLVNALLPARPTPAPRPQPTRLPRTPTALLPQLPRAVVAYDAPGGTPLGAIEPGRRYTVLAARDDGWRLLVVAGSGEVWVRGWELDGAPPTPTPTPVPSATPLPTAAPPTPPPPPPPAPVFVPAPPPPVPQEYCHITQAGNVSSERHCAATPDGARAAADAEFAQRWRAAVRNGTFQP